MRQALRSTAALLFWILFCCTVTWAAFWGTLLFATEPMALVVAGGVALSMAGWMVMGLKRVKD